MKDKLILGTVQFGLSYGINNSTGLPTEDTVNAILDKAFDSGISLLDTAAAYGLAESRIGSYHKLKTNRRFAVNTKFSKDASITWLESLTNSINLMKIEQIDTIMFHSFEAYQNNKQDLKNIYSIGATGYFKRIGVSVYTNEELETLLSDELITVVQLPFNMLDNEFLRMPILKKLKAAGKEIHTRSSFLQGLFFKDLDTIPANLKALKPQLILIRELANQHNVDVGHLALQYCLSKDYIDKVLIGVESLSQLDLNLKWSTEKIDVEIFKKIDAIIVNNIALLNPSKW